MFEITYTKNFLKNAKKIPAHIQDKLAVILEFLQSNPFHPLLHTKPLTGHLAGFFSFRITREWRVIFCFVDDFTIKFITIGHRKDIYE